MTLSSDCDLLYISWQVAACAQECCSRLALSRHPWHRVFTTPRQGAVATSCWLCVLQGPTDNPHVCDHHGGNAEYNQVFHSLCDGSTGDETGVSLSGIM